MYTLAICERFSPTKHVITNKSSRDIEEHWMVYTTIDVDEFYDGSYNDDINMLRSNSTDATHSIKLDITLVQQLEGGEHVGVFKTFWLGVLQRKWKTLHEIKHKLIRQRGNLLSLRERQLTGKWRKT